MPITVQSLSEWEESGINGLLSIVIPAHNEEGARFWRKRKSQEEGERKNRE